MDGNLSALDRLPVNDVGGSTVCYRTCPAGSCLVTYFDG